LTALRPALCALGVATTIALAGCAAQTAYRQGQQLVADGRELEGLARFEEASRLEPGSAQYRMATIQTRDRWLTLQLDRAEALRQREQLEEAEQAYRQVLAVHGSNDTAIRGLRAVDQQRRAQALLKDANAALEKKDADSARANLTAILRDNPAHGPARKLLQRLEEQAARPAPETALAAAYRQPITIEFKDAPLRSVFEVISRSSGLNFLFDKDVRADQKASIFLKNSTIEQAVNLTLLTNQLEQRVLDAHTVLIYPNTQAKQKDYQPLTVKSFYLANADAKTVAATLKALLKTRDVVVDDKLNLLIVRDSPEAIRLAEKLVALHDVPEPEVMLEVEILEVKRTRLLDLGIRWPDHLALTPLPIGGGDSLTIADLRGLRSSRIAAAVGAVNISAQKLDTDANILANPRIRVRNREKAKILIGERVPNITATSTTTGFLAESVNYVDVGLKLDVEPTIYLDGEVAIKVSLEVSSIISQLQTKAGSLAYQIGTRTAQTVLRLKDGENQVLAGLINDEERRTANKVPLLGEVPIVGRLFGNQADDGSKTEIVLSITPRILRNVHRPDASVIEFDSGTENSLGGRPVGTGAGLGVGNPQTANALAEATALAPVSAIAAPDRPTGPQPGAMTNNAIVSPGGASGPANLVVAASPSVIRWQGPSQAKVGDTVSLQLLMQSDQPIVSVPAAIGFDPRVLQVTSVVEGDFLGQGGAATSFNSRIDPNGQILLTGTRVGDNGATASGIVATVNFRVASAVAAETQVRLLTIAPLVPGGAGASATVPQPYNLRVVPN
jgi:general secretion pathway protein D